jgi:serine/threonine protein kinase
MLIAVMGAVVGDDPLLVMECMEHGSLRELLLNETFVLEPQILLSLLRDVAAGMKFLHMASPPIVHNDIKASNILVDRNMRAKIADFGLSTNRKAGIIAGTPAFIAPEVLRGEQPTTASDAYSFAITMFEVRCSSAAPMIPSYVVSYAFLSYACRLVSHRRVATFTAIMRDTKHCAVALPLSAKHNAQ